MGILAHLITVLIISCICFSSGVLFGMFLFTYHNHLEKNYSSYDTDFEDKSVSYTEDVNE